MCRCIEQLDKKLEEYNTQVNVSISLNGGSAQIYLDTFKRDKTKRGNAMKLLATYCPICGEKYETTRQ